jgi:hypothetical protein
MQLYALSTTSFGRYVFDYLTQKKANTGRGNVGGRIFNICQVLLVNKRGGDAKSLDISTCIVEPIWDSKLMLLTDY